VYGDSDGQGFSIHVEKDGPGIFTHEKLNFSSEDEAILYCNHIEADIITPEFQEIVSKEDWLENEKVNDKWVEEIFTDEFIENEKEKLNDSLPRFRLRPDPTIVHLN
jgi:hypothetical protein